MGVASPSEDPPAQARAGKPSKPSAASQFGAKDRGSVCKIEFIPERQRTCGDKVAEPPAPPGRRLLNFRLDGLVASGSPGLSTSIWACESSRRLR